MTIRAKWDPNLHPRGPIGRFIPSGSSGARPWARGEERAYGPTLIGRRLPPKYSQGESVALANYQAEFGNRVNATLRNRRKPTPYEQEQLGLIDSAIERERLAADTRLYRGIGLGGAELMEQLRAGDQIVDWGYLSTASDEDTASDFGDWTMEIDAPAGTHVALFRHGQENEVLIGRGSVLEVYDVVREETPWGHYAGTIHARLVGYLDD